MRPVCLNVRPRIPIRAMLLVGVAVLTSSVAFAQAKADPPDVQQAPAQATPQKQGPRIEMEQVEVDLGELVRGETAEARFAIHNRGDETLRILQAKPG